MRHWIFITFILASMTALFAGCAKKRKATEELVKECVVIPGQEYSFQGVLDVIPVKLLFESSWGAESADIVAAANTWNTFTTKVHDFALFDANGGNVTTQNLTAPTCSFTTTQGVPIYRRGSWTASESAVVAKTTITSCGATVNAKGLTPIKAAIMEFNYVNFFTGTNPMPDRQSIALHELGHLLGLDHSCGPLKNGQSNIGCPDQKSDPKNFLFSTVMFPDVFFRDKTGEVKRTLRGNDQGRTNCIYGK